MNHTFDYYKTVANDVYSILFDNDCTTIIDIQIIYNIIMGYPYCIDGTHFIYNGKLYDDLFSMPIEGIQQWSDRCGKID